LNLEPYTLNSPSSRRLLIFLGAAIAAGFFLYPDAIVKVVSAVINREDSSHGIFVPVLSVYFLWLKKDELKSVGLQTDYAGLFLLLPAVAASFLKIGSFQLRFLIFIAFMAGLVWLLYGRSFFKKIGFPLFFLAGMIPIPEDSYISIANYSRHIAFSGALKVISFFGVPYFRDGWLLHLPHSLLEVAIGCSGIRYLISYFVFAIAYAYLFRSALTGRLLTVALSIPISVVASILRLVFIFLAAHYISPRMAEPRPHILISWAVFFGVLILAIALDQYFAGRKKVIRQDRPD